jgi:hypothetical protein
MAESGRDRTWERVNIEYLAAHEDRGAQGDRMAQAGLPVMSGAMAQSRRELSLQAQRSATAKWALQGRSHFPLVRNDSLVENFDRNSHGMRSFHRFGLSGTVAYAPPATVRAAGFEVARIAHTTKSGWRSYSALQMGSPSLESIRSRRTWVRRLRSL